MASVNGGNSALVNKMVGTGASAVPAKRNVKALLADINIKKQFEDMLGKHAASFISSIISVTNGNKQLKSISDNNPMSIISAGAIAATLNLPVDPNLGFAYIIPYGDKATFQMGYKGFIQLAMRTGQYKTINASEVYEGEIRSVNRFTGEIEFGDKTSDTVVGYMSYFKLINGFEKYLYMTKEEVEKHAKAFSKSFNHKDGRWQLDFHAMAIKTVLKRLLSKYGILSVEMQGMGTALSADQSVVSSDVEGNPTFEYIDVDGQTVDTETGEVVNPETSQSEESIKEKHARMTGRLNNEEDAGE